MIGVKFVDSNNMIGLMLTVCIAVLGVIIFSNTIKKIIKLLFNGILGGIIIYLSNPILLPLGINVGVNIFTLLISAFLGLPGLIVIFIIQAIL